jgi:hypothetical protein
MADREVIDLFSKVYNVYDAKIEADKWLQSVIKSDYKQALDKKRQEIQLQLTRQSTREQTIQLWMEYRGYVETDARKKVVEWEESLFTSGRDYDDGVKACHETITSLRPLTVRVINMEGVQHLSYKGQRYEFITKDYTPLIPVIQTLCSGKRSQCSYRDDRLQLALE